jgi:hypothetical protein
MYLVLIGVSFGLGFAVGKIAAIRRLSKWIAALPEQDQATVRGLLPKKKG